MVQPGSQSSALLCFVLHIAALGVLPDLGLLFAFQVTPFKSTLSRAAVRTGIFVVNWLSTAPQAAGQHLVPAGTGAAGGAAGPGSAQHSERPAGPARR